ncbi:MAG: hypothetical protein J5927_06230 [Oscillospiraceae bacterium]|nr:hypothetical protein [Oscillospiraceae bacterium]
MSKEAALAFLEKHGMDPKRIAPLPEAKRMAEEMERGLAGEPCSLDMIPTYLGVEGDIPQNIPVAVIDAGGTNFRSALVTFTEDGMCVEEMRKWRMPGTHEPVTWEDFIRFTADSVEGLLDRTERIGFCFSYPAIITPNMDGQVLHMDKEVVVTGCEGKKIGEALNAELKRRGWAEKKIVVLNDTVAVLLAGAATRGGTAWGGYVGQVSGTGTNTCCVLPVKRIGKLDCAVERGMIVNLESGGYVGLPTGDFDRTLDRMSNSAGEKHLEKMTAGVYLGELVRLMLKAAAEEGELSEAAADKARGLARIDSAVIDAWACGENLEEICEREEDREFVVTLCRAAFERSARCMCTNLAAILLLTGEGMDANKPVCLFAEGSLVQKGRVYRPILEELIQQEIEGGLGRHMVLHVGQETTLPGSAAASLLNT